MSNQTGAQFREIYRPNCYYNDKLYRATSNGHVVNIQTCKISTNYRTIRQVSQAEWNEFFNRRKLDEPSFRDCSGIIAKFATSKY